MVECIKSCYCNHFHRLSDGVPINHKCRVLSPGFLQAEKTNDLEGMLAYFEADPEVVLHDGEASDEVAEDDDPPSFTAGKL